MSLDEIYSDSNCFFMRWSIVYLKTAGLFGYPGNPGMSTIYDLRMTKMLDQNFLKIFHHIGLFFQSNDQRHGLKRYFGPSQKLTQFQDMYMKTGKKDSIIFMKIIKIFILPDWLSNFFKLRLHFCLDITLFRDDS
jgi:hypothetical protein